MSERDQIQADAVSRTKDMYRRSQSYNMNTFPNGYNGNISSSQQNRQPQNQSVRQQHSSTGAVPQSVSEKTVTNNQEANIAEDTDKSSEAQVAQPSAAAGVQSESVPEIKNNAPPTVQAQGNDFLDSIFQDKERALIILLIALFGEERANSSILLALMYLMM